MPGEHITNKVDMSLLWNEFPQFKGVEFRVDEDLNEGSILDATGLVLQTAEAAKSAWFDMKRDPRPEIKELVARSNQVRINGKGKPTPVAPFPVLLEIIFLLPGKRAHEFRRASAKYIARLLSGDLSLIDEIEARYENSTLAEREFFRNGTDETPDRKRRREDLEDERRLRLRREEAEIKRLEMENQKFAMDNLTMYESMLERLGLDSDPRMRQLVNDTAANMLVPNQGLKAIESPVFSDYITVGKFVVDRGIACKSASVLGRLVSKAWREEMGKEPETTQMVVNGDVRTVKLYPTSFLEKHVM